MDVSIVIINYNTFDITCNCITSIIEKTKKNLYEIILVDNASAECDPKLFLEKFPTVKLIISEENIGFSKGNNLGITYATAENILLINSDTIFAQDSISLVLPILSNPKIGAATCQLRSLNDSVQHNCQSFPSTFKSLIERLRVHKLFLRQLKSNYLQGFYWDYKSSGFPQWIWGTFFLFKKQILKELPGGKLNDDYFMYLEDMQWCWDLKKVGYKIFYTPDTFVYHLIGASGANRSEMIKENLKIFTKKNYYPL
jgi:GT2 family glycosyltransferase